MIRELSARAVELVCNVLGRRCVIRAARFVLRSAYLDVPNDLESNGEVALQRWVLGLSERGRMLSVVDVGANVGRWSRSMLAVADRGGRSSDLNLHAFEPASYTYKCLLENLGGRQIRLEMIALSDDVGSAKLHIVAPGAGVNSLHEQPRLTVDSTEDVGTTTLDTYSKGAGLKGIDFLKIDTEGHDLSVLRGARELLREGRIGILQFEYNHRWIYSRAFLRDVFELLEEFDYRIGKLTPGGVEFYPRWDPDLETFVEGNYVACRWPTAAQLPSVKWWKMGKLEKE